MDKRKKVKLRKAFNRMIYSITIVSFVFTCFGLFFQIQTYREQNPGNLEVKYHDSFISNGESKTIVCFVKDNTDTIKDLAITPSFRNKNRYAINAFCLFFDLEECSNIILTPSGHVKYDTHEAHPNSFQYNANILEPYINSQNPFSSIILTDSIGHCVIKSRATHNGIRTPFECKCDLWFFVESKSEDWDSNLVLNKYRMPPSELANCNDFYFVSKYGSDYHCTNLPNFLNETNTKFDPYSEAYNDIDLGEFFIYLLVILLTIMVVYGLYNLLYNIVVIVGTHLTMKKYFGFSFMDALNCSTFCLFRTGFNVFESEKQALAFRTLTILTLISPFNLFILFAILTVLI